MSRSLSLESIKKIINKSYYGDIRNYYFFNKSFVKNLLGVSLFFGSFYLINRNYPIKKYVLMDPIDEILNSKEVKGAGIDLIEDLFKDRRTKQNVLIALKSVIKEKDFEKEFKVFIKAWLFKVIKDKEFLKQTKVSLIEVLKSKPVMDETTTLLKFVAEYQQTKETVADVFKGMFLSKDVFDKMCHLFEKCCLNAIQSERNKSQVNMSCNELMSNNEFRTKLFTKALNVFSSAGDTPLEYKNLK